MHLASTSVEALNALDPRSLLSALGALGVFLILFAETGLLVGFFLPGDSLLFTAGLLCTTSASAAVQLSLPAVLVAGGPGGPPGAPTRPPRRRPAAAPPPGPPAPARRRGPAGRPDRLPDRPSGRTPAAGPARPAAPAGRRDPFAHRPRPLRGRQGDRAGAVHPPRTHRAQPDGRHRRGPRPGVHLLAGGRRAGLVDRAHPGRLRAGLPDPEHRQVPAADRRPDHRGVPDPGGAGGPPQPGAPLSYVSKPATSASCGRSPCAAPGWCPRRSG